MFYELNVDDDKKKKHLASPKQGRDHLNQGVLGGGRLGGGVVVVGVGGGVC